MARDRSRAAALRRPEPAEPVPARVTEAARPVVVQGVVRVDLPIGVYLQAGLLDSPPVQRLTRP